MQKEGRERREVGKGREEEGEKDGKWGRRKVGGIRKEKA